MLHLSCVCNQELIYKYRSFVPVSGSSASSGVPVYAIKLCIRPTKLPPNLRFAPLNTLIFQVRHVGSSCCNAGQPVHTFKGYYRNTPGNRGRIYTSVCNKGIYVVGNNRIYGENDMLNCRHKVPKPNSANIFQIHQKAETNSVPSSCKDDNISGLGFRTSAARSSCGQPYEAPRMASLYRPCFCTPSGGIIPQEIFKGY